MLKKVAFLAVVLVVFLGSQSIAGAEERATICYGNYPVRARSFIFFPFAISRSASVEGHFEVAGGAGNDIQVVIGRRTEVLNWLNGHSADVDYASEKLTSGDVQVSVSNPGDYILAFNNKFSLVSDKRVGANFQLVADDDGGR
jgi:hypothetical protein